MDLYVVEKDGLQQFAADLIESGSKVVGVKDKKSCSGIPGDKGFFTYQDITNPSEYTLSFDVTQIPPKKFLQPERESLFSFDLSGKGQIKTETDENQRLVLFGVHPYDIVAISQMDKVFAVAPADIPYLQRRQNTIIIGIDPVKVAPRAFWSSVEADKCEGGFDMMLTDIGTCYVLEIGSNKGNDLKRLLKSRPATPSEAKERERVRAEVKARCDASGLKFPASELPGILARNENNIIWEEKARLCFSCGTCNLVCPTCYCFDVRDEINIDLKGGNRYRVWDGCLLNDFAKVAGGGNFRPNRADRYRHRFYRKGWFIFERFGDVACVGCGRCSVQCPSDIADPVNVFNRLKEEI